jgi:hypothetical protein
VQSISYFTPQCGQSTRKLLRPSSTEAGWLQK